MFGSPEGLTAALQRLLAVLQVRSHHCSTISWLVRLQTRSVSLGSMPHILYFVCNQHNLLCALQAVGSDAVASSAAAGALGAVVALHQGFRPADASLSPQPRAVGAPYLRHILGVHRNALWWRSQSWNCHAVSVWQCTCRGDVSVFWCRPSARSVWHVGAGSAAHAARARVPHGPCPRFRGCRGLWRHHRYPCSLQLTMTWCSSCDIRVEASVTATSYLTSVLWGGSRADVKPGHVSHLAGLLDGPVGLAAALLAAGGPAAEPGQAVIRTNVGNLVLNLLQEAAEVTALLVWIELHECCSSYGREKQWSAQLSKLFSQPAAICTARPIDSKSPSRPSSAISTTKPLGFVTRPPEAGAAWCAAGGALTRRRALAGGGRGAAGRAGGPLRLGAAAKGHAAGGAGAAGAGPPARSGETSGSRASGSRGVEAHKLNIVIIVFDVEVS